MYQSNGLFQSELRTNLQVLSWLLLPLIQEATTLSWWFIGLVVFLGGEDPKTGSVVGVAFQEEFSHAKCTGKSGSSATNLGLSPEPHGLPIDQQWNK
jgi:hypothetical protein